MCCTARCLNGISWEGVDLLAPSTVLYVDVEDESYGNCCCGGLLNYVEDDNDFFEENYVYPCLQEWRIFNLQGDRESDQSVLGPFTELEAHPACGGHFANSSPSQSSTILQQSWRLCRTRVGILSLLALEC